MMMMRFRHWLIRLLAGKDLIMLNAARNEDGSISATNPHSDRGLVFGCVFHAIGDRYKLDPQGYAGRAFSLP